MSSWHVVVRVQSCHDEAFDVEADNMSDAVLKAETVARDGCHAMHASQMSHLPPFSVVAAAVSCKGETSMAARRQISENKRGRK